jgi:MFS family permease
MLYITITLFAVGSVVAAVAQDFTTILVGRTIQGVGGGGILTLSEIIVTDLVPLAFRAQWFTALSSMWAIGTVTGPLIGSGFAQDVTWRWIFWVNLPIVGLGFFSVILFLNQVKIPGDILGKLRRFDWIGSFLFTASATSFLIPMSWGGVQYDWTSFRTLVPLLLGAAGLVAFGFYELYFATTPIINKGVFNNWTMTVTYITTVLHGMILWCLLYYAPLYYQGVKGYTPVVSALALLPETLTVARKWCSLGFQNR